MPRYVYDPKLPPHENKRRALEVHSIDGPPVALVVGTGWDTQSAGHVLSDGALLPASGGSMPQEPAEKPGPDVPFNSWQMDQWRDTLARRVLYWKLRLERAGKQFDAAYNAALRNPTEQAALELEQLLAESQYCAARLKQAEQEQAPYLPVQYVPASTGTVSAERVALERRIAGMRRG